MSDITILLTITSTYTLYSSTLAPSSSNVSPKYITKLVTITTVASSSSLSPSSGASSTSLSSISTDSKSTTSTMSSASSSTTVAATASEVAAELETFQSSSNTDSSLKIGLAVGIPVGVLGLFCIVIGLFVWLKRRNFNKQREKSYRSGVSLKDVESFVSGETLTQMEKKSQAYGTELGTKEQVPGISNPYTTRQIITESPLLPPAPAFLAPKRTASNPSLNELGSDTRRQSVRYFLADRLSKVINGKEAEEIHSHSIPQPSFSPMILKRFKLSRQDDASENGNEPSVRNKKNLKLSVIAPARLEQPEVHHRKYIVVRPYEKLLDDEVSIEIGDLVAIIHEYPDGWCKIERVEGGTGMVPKTCLQSL